MSLYCSTWSREFSNALESVLMFATLSTVVDAKWLLQIPVRGGVGGATVQWCTSVAKRGEGEPQQ
jgi:hypothetical protein